MKKIILVLTVIFQCSILFAQDVGNEDRRGVITVFESNTARNNRAILHADEKGAYLRSTWGTGGTDAISFRNSDNESEMVIAKNGNVGIGVENPSSGYKLQVKDGFKIINGNTDLLLYRDSDVGDWSLLRTNLGNGIGLIGKPDHVAFSVGRLNSFVGIWNKNPIYPFDVAVPTRIRTVDSRNLMLEKEDGDVWLTFHDPNDNWFSMGYDKSINKFSLNPGGNLDIDKKFVMDNLGFVGIGTANPDAKLTVKGKIHAEEVKIDLNIPADYVFQKYYLGVSALKADYVMPTLEEVEAYVKTNHHLPEVPPAKQIQEEGIQVSEMVNKLLQKIEELTLYTIEQEKRLNAQQKEIEKLKNKN